MQTVPTLGDYELPLTVIPDVTHGKIASCAVPPIVRIDNNREWSQICERRRLV